MYESKSSEKKKGGMVKLSYDNHIKFQSGRKRGKSGDLTDPV